MKCKNCNHEISPCLGQGFPDAPSFLHTNEFNEYFEFICPLCGCEKPEPRKSVKYEPIGAHPYDYLILRLLHDLNYGNLTEREIKDKKKILRIFRKINKGRI